MSRVQQACRVVCQQYENLDEEHKGLFQGIFKVAGAPGDAAALSSLVDLVKKHFATEEVGYVHSVVLTLWRPLLPYGYSYKASCARPG